ncbi:MAG: SCO family protein [Bryobacterales bacterium]
MCAQPEPLPEYGQTPAFELTERSGRTALVRACRQGLGRRLHLHHLRRPPARSCRLLRRRCSGHSTDATSSWSFTVDPERDTPEVLSAYAKRYKADPERALPHRRKQALYDMIKKGVLLAVDDGSLTQGDTPGPGIA